MSDHFLPDQFGSECATKASVFGCRLCLNDTGGNNVCFRTANRRCERCFQSASTFQPLHPPVATTLCPPSDPLPFCGLLLLMLLLLLLPL